MEPLTPVTLIDGVDSVIIDAIQSSTKRERNLTFKLEDNIVKFMAVTNRKKLVFPPLSSHHRLILHRLADRFNLAHIVSEDTNDAGKTNNSGRSDNAGNYCNAGKAENAGKSGS